MEEVSKRGQKSILALISYLGILCLVPILMKEKDEFVKFHARQGLVLFICEVGTWILFRFIVPLSNLLGLLWLILSIVGIVNVLNKRRKKLPFVGGFAEKFKF